MKPVIVLVGRPNVGKSTLFNRLTRSRSALVADEPGLTRDRRYGEGVVGDRPYVAVDTGGIVETLAPGRRRHEPDALTKLMLTQTRQALVEADAVILIVDGHEGMTPIDEQIAADLRRTGKRIWVVVNKTEGMDPDIAEAEFYALRLGRPMAISAAHGDGVTRLMELVLRELPAVAVERPERDIPCIAVVGRPNAGKSTLVNALLGEERVVVAEQPGTTRDSVEVPLERDGTAYIVVDTAGVRRRARIDKGIEKYSVIKTLEAIDRSNVVLLVLDAQAGVSAQDATLGGYVMRRGRSMVLVVNKWDAVDTAGRARIKQEIGRLLPFLDFVQVRYVSALKGMGVSALFGAIDAAFDSARKTLTTPKLNRVLRNATLATAPPLVRGRRIRLKFAHQGGRNPPVIVIHGTQASALPDSYRRYLAHAFRKAFGLVGTPLRIECRQGENPFERRRSAKREVRKRGQPVR